MRVDTSFKNMKASAILKSIVEKNVEKISRRLKVVKKEEAVHISVHIEKNPHKEQFFCWATIYMPTKVITAKRSDNDVFSAVNNVFSALSKQMERVKHRIDRHLVKKNRRSFKNLRVDNI